MPQCHRRHYRLFSRTKSNVVIRHTTQVQGVQCNLSPRRKCQYKRKHSLVSDSDSESATDSVPHSSVSDEEYVPHLNDSEPDSDIDVENEHILFDEMRWVTCKFPI